MNELIEKALKNKSSISYQEWKEIYYFALENEIELTNREFMLLKILIENKNIVLTRDVLMEKVCGYDYVGETNVIDVYIRYLRTKIDDRFNIKIITTVRGVGYVIKDE